MKEIELDLDLAQYIRNIPDFPQPGVQFKDITTLLKEGPAFRETIERLVGLYDLEYGSATLEIHRDAIEKGQKVIIVDDLLATGGTTRAVCEMVEELGGRIIGIGFVIELESLKGREKLSSYPVHSLIRL